MPNDVVDQVEGNDNELQFPFGDHMLENQEGDEADPADGEPEVADLEPEAPAPAAESDNQFIFRGLNKSLKTQDELIAYANELERKQIEAEAQLAVYKEQRGIPAKDEPEAPVTTQELKKKYAAKLFSDPEGALDEFERDLMEKIEKKQTTTASEKKFWSDFYEEFSDLSGLEEIVQLQLYKNQEQWKKVPMAQARKLLAHEARSYVGRIRDLKADSTTLPKGPAVTAGATRTPAPRVEKSEPEMNFADQVRKLNKRGPAVKAG